MLITIIAIIKHASEKDAYSYSLELISPALISANETKPNGCIMQKNTIIVPLNQYFSDHACIFSESCPNSRLATKDKGYPTAKYTPKISILTIEFTIPEL
jgi:hypothetical protein